MNTITMQNARMVERLRPILGAPVLRWVALLGLCAAYLQGGFDKAADFSSAEGLAKLPLLTTRYPRIALTQKLRRIIDEGVGNGLALEGISAAEVGRAQ
jgi:hypothetical protein